MKKIIIAALLSVLPVAAVAAPVAPTASPQSTGFYIGVQHIHAYQIRAAVRKFGAGAVRFVPPAKAKGPLGVRVQCGRFQYSYVYFPGAASKDAIWKNTTGKAVVEKMITACERVDDFSLVIVPMSQGQ